MDKIRNKTLLLQLKRFFIMNKIRKGNFDPFFILPLQVYDDIQVKYHCDYKNIEEFLREVLISFVNYAPEESKLIIKHHPMDRGFVNYKHIINFYKKEYPNLNKRVCYIHDISMPILLRKAIGMVTLNSTSGISALLHNVPVITLGRANYNIPKLTYQGKLDSFWKNNEKPDMEIFNAYRKYHLYKTHINGSYYTKVLFE